MTGAISERYDTVIGLEVHVQLLTRTKLFCHCRNLFGCEANTNTCPVCLGMPGTLPVLNRQAFDLALRTALAVGARISPTTKFDRKHYFYPDLPKGYQISQYDEPYCLGGGLEIEVEGRRKFVSLTRIHMEEDAGKMFHTEDSHMADSLVDLNRAGTPLMEMVTDPVLTSPAEAFAYLTDLKQLLLYIEVSDCNMQEGSLRCDANISLKPKGDPKFGTKVEIKNMNSFKGVAAALEYEIRRQAQCLDTGRKIDRETRLFDPDAGVTQPMRSKEEADDYRFFPEPDLPRYAITPEWVAEIRASLPELPQARRARLKEQYGLPAYDVEELLVDKGVADYFEACAAHGHNPKEVSNWIMGEIKRLTGERHIPIRDFEVGPEALASLVESVEKGDITKGLAKDKVFPEMVRTRESAGIVIERLGLKVVRDDAALLPIIADVLSKNAKIVQDVLGGKDKAMGALVGQCMRATQGKADPQLVASLLKRRLDEMRAAAQ